MKDSTYAAEDPRPIATAPRLARKRSTDLLRQRADWHSTERWTLSPDPSSDDRKRVVYIGELDEAYGLPALLVIAHRYGFGVDVIGTQSPGKRAVHALKYMDVRSSGTGDILHVDPPVDEYFRLVSDATLVFAGSKDFLERSLLFACLNVDKVRLMAFDTHPVESEIEVNVLSKGFVKTSSIEKGALLSIRSPYSTSEVGSSGYAAIEQAFRHTANQLAG